MAGTREGAAKARATIYEKYGRDFYVGIGRQGGQNGHTGGFFANPELAKEAGRKGGKISKRGKAKFSRTPHISDEDYTILTAIERLKNPEDKAVAEKAAKLIARDYGETLRALAEEEASK